MKFIRKNGRIIPIREKGEKAENYEQRLTRSDVKMGLASGLAQSLFFKRTSVQLAAGLGSIAHGGATSVKRYQNNGVIKAAWEDTKSSYLKSIATLGGGLAGFGALAGLNKLNKLRKTVKLGKKAKKAFKGKLIK